MVQDQKRIGVQMNNKVDSNDFFKSVKRPDRIQFQDKVSRLDILSTHGRFSVGISYDKFENLEETIGIIKTTFDRVRDPLSTEELEFIKTTAVEKLALHKTKNFVKREDDLKRYEKY